MRIVVAGLLCLFSLISLVDVSVAEMQHTFRGQLYSHQYTHLIDTNQSQIFEPMSASLQNFPRYAGVRFIIDKTPENVEFTDPNIEACKKDGFTKKVADCEAEWKNPGFLCPHENSYTDTCCDKSYKYTKSECTYPRTLGTSCGGKYLCYCDRALFPWGESKTCASPLVFDTSSSCIEDGKTYYSGCVCPSVYNQQCSGNNLEGSGSSCTNAGVTKYTACKCKAGYTLTCSDYGPANANDFCLLNGNKYYKSCKDCTAPSGFSSSPCSSDQVIQEQQEVCRTTYYKCRAVAAGDILYSDKTISGEVIAGKIPVGVIFNTAKSLAIALEQKNTSWGPEGLELPDVKCKYKECNQAGEDIAKSGQRNTLYLIGIKESKSKSFPATEYAYTYVPNKADSTSWCGKNKWFLPSNDEWYLLNSVRNVVNQTFAKLGTIQLAAQTNYWSSNSTRYDDMSYTYYLGNGEYILVENYRRLTEHGNPAWKHYARPFLNYSGSGSADTCQGKDNNATDLSQSNSAYICSMCINSSGTRRYICTINDTCKGEDNSDTDLSLNKNGYSCMSCINSTGKKRYICSCTSGTVYSTVIAGGYKYIELSACPLYASCSPQMCNNKYYLKGCQKDNGSISTAFEDGDRIFCKTTNTCDKIEFREDAQGSHSGVVSEGNEVIIPIPGMITQCDKCSLVGYYSSQPSGKLCKTEKIAGTTCFKQCCSEGYTYDVSGKNGAGCYTCKNGSYNPSAHKCDCDSGYSPSWIDPTSCCLNGYVHDPDGKEGNKCYNCDNGKPYDPLLHRCPCNDGAVFDENGINGASCYKCSGGGTYNPTTHKCE